MREKEWGSGMVSGAKLPGGVEHPPTFETVGKSVPFSAFVGKSRAFGTSKSREREEK